jgi:hypothetical protein
MFTDSKREDKIFFNKLKLSNLNKEINSLRMIS